MDPKGNASGGADMSRGRPSRWVAACLVLFLAGIGCGLVIALCGLPPYPHLTRLQERYLTPRPQFGGTPLELLETDPRRLIALHSPSDIAALRSEITQLLWNRPELPAGPPQRLEAVTPEPRFRRFANLRSVERLTTQMEFGLDSRAWHLIPARPNGTLVLYHHGHTAGARKDRERIGRLLDGGYGVVELFMPLYGPNSRPRLDLPRIGRFSLTSHEHLRLLDPARGHGLRYFLEPIVRVVNHLSPRYRRVAIMGYSGGGRMAMIAAALDPRISAGFTVASTYPYYLLSAGELGDFEQSDPDFYRRATHLELMVMAGSGPGRQAVQILNRYDPCCFAGRRAEAYAPAVRDAVRAIGPGEFTMIIDESEREHGISRQAMAMILRRLERLR